MDLYEVQTAYMQSFDRPPSFTTLYLYENQTHEQTAYMQSFNLLASELWICIKDRQLLGDFQTL